MKDIELMEKFTCHDCKQILDENAEYHDYKNGFIKCRSCHEKDSVLRNFQETECYTRIVGYMRPVKQWNPGKKAEYGDRVEFIPKT